MAQVEIMVEGSAPLDIKEKNFVGGLVDYEDVNVKHSKTSKNKRAKAIQILCGLPEMQTPKRRYSMARACLLEFCFVALFFYMHIMIVNVGLAFFSVPSLAIGLGHVFVVPVFIWCAGPGSGGHLVNTITIATTMTGHTSWLRCIFYLISQILGSLVGVWLTYQSIGWDFSNMTDEQITAHVYLHLAGCSLGSHTVNSALMQEFMATLVLLCGAYGIAFDPMNSKLFGPLLGPPLIGMWLGLLIFVTSASSPTPASPPGMTFHICLAPAVVSGYMPDFLWIYLLGPFLAALFHSVIFYVAPPEHNEEGCFSPPLLREAVTDEDPKKDSLVSSRL